MSYIGEAENGEQHVLSLTEQIFLFAIFSLYSLGAINLKKTGSHSLFCMATQLARSITRKMSNIQEKYLILNVFWMVLFLGRADMKREGDQLLNP